MQRTGIVPFGVVLLCTALASGCTKTNPAYCESNAECVGNCLLNRCEETLPDANLACTVHTQCAGICGATNECEPCGNCIVRGDDRLVCDPGGTCVECVDNDDCSDATPACVVARCERCSAHEQCEQRTMAEVGLCDDVAGTCLVAADVLVVDVNDQDCDGGAGTPYCEIDAAASAISNGNPISDVQVLSGTYRRFTADVDMRIVGTDQQAVTVDANSNAAAIEITSGAAVEVRRMTVRGATSANNSAGVWCRNGATCTLSQITAVFSSIGIRANNARLFLSRSTIESNGAGGGISVDGTEFVITNNAIVNNGSVNSAFGGVSLGSDAGGARVFAHNTLSDNFASNSFPGAVTCSLATTLSSNVFWQNKTPEVNSFCEVHYSVIEDSAIGMINNNTQADPLLLSTSNPYNMHIGAGSSCIDTGDPNGTVAYDIDGEPRTDGLPDIGSDEMP